MHLLLEGFATYIFICAGIAVLAYLCDRPILLWGLVGAIAALIYIDVNKLWPTVVAHAPTVFGVGLLGLFVVAFVGVLVFDWIPRGWRFLVPWLDWIWRHPMDNSTGPRRESEPPDARSREG
jgi:hypothetical protein